MHGSWTGFWEERAKEMALIEVKNASYYYESNSPEKTAAVKNVSIDIDEGECWAVIGRTGSGKSTLTEMMAGLLKPCEGSVKICGTDTKTVKHAVREIRGKVGLVFQYPEHQLFEETVLKDAAFGPKNLGYSEAEAMDMAREALRLVGMEEKYDERSPFALSGGQKRRAAIAGVIAMRPEVLILDEPTAGLDPAGRDLLLNVLKEIKGKRCKSVVFVSHSMEDVAETVDKVLVMSGGCAVMSGTVKEVYSQREALSSIGLDVPQIARLMGRLGDMGYDFKRGILTVGEAADAIYERLKGRTNA